MAYDNSDTFSTGDVHTAADHTQIKDNFDAGFPYGTTWQTYTPQLTAVTTDPTLGSGATQQGRYYRIGQLVTVTVDIVFGTSGAAGSGAYRVSLPITASSSPNDETVAGSGRLLDSGTRDYLAIPKLVTTRTYVQMNWDGAGSVSDSSPFTWGTSGDAIRLLLSYEAA